MGTAEAIDELLSREQGVWLDVLLLQLDVLLFFFFFLFQPGPVTTYFPLTFSSQPLRQGVSQMCVCTHAQLLLPDPSLPALGGGEEYIKK